MCKKMICGLLTAEVLLPISTASEIAEELPIIFIAYTPCFACPVVMAEIHAGWFITSI